MNSFSAEKFRTLEAIFSWKEDLAVLESEPGYTLSIGRGFCRARSRLGRRWIREVRAEFDRLYRHGQMILVASPVDRPDLVRDLWRVKRNFYRNLILLEIRLFLNLSLASDVRR